MDLQGAKVMQTLTHTILIKLRFFFQNDEFCFFSKSIKMFIAICETVYIDFLSYIVNACFLLNVMPSHTMDLSSLTKSRDETIFVLVWIQKHPGKSKNFKKAIDMIRESSQDSIQR